MTVEIEHDKDVKELLRENLELTKEIHGMTKKIKRHITFQKIITFVYLIIIVAPIILSVIFLPPLIKNILGQYQGLLGGDAGNLLDLLKGTSGGFNLDSLKNLDSSNSLDASNIDIKKLPPEVQKLIQEQQKK